MNRLEPFACTPSFLAPTVVLGGFRRQLKIELRAIQTSIAQAGIQDDITQRIAQWCNDFAKALDTHRDEHHVLDLYVPPLLQILEETLATCLIPETPQGPHPILSQMMTWIKQHAPRQVFLAQLKGIHHAITQSGLQDEMTLLINRWQERFTRALQTDLPIHEISTEYIRLMQQLLRDSITDAPLDEEAVLGSDRTYAKISLDLFILSASPIQRGRCPLDLTNPAPFTTVPHPVARHLTRFLRSYHALQESLELKRALMLRRTQAAALPQVPLAQARQARLDRIMAATAAANREQAQRLREQTAMLDRQLDERFASLTLIISQGVADVRDQAACLLQEGTLQIHEGAQHHREQIQELQNQLDRAVENQNQDFLNSARQLEQVASDGRAALEASRKDLERARTEEEQALNHVEARVQAALQNTLAPLGHRIQTLQTTGEEPVRLHQQDLEAVRQVEAMIECLDREIETLDQSILRLEAEETQVMHRLTIAEQNERMLRIDTQKTEREMKEMKRRNKKQAIKMGAGLIISGLVTWGGTCALAEAGSRATCTVTPLRGGAYAGFSIPF